MAAAEREEIIAGIRAFLEKRFPDKVGIDCLGEDQDLQATVIDSLDTIEIISHVEATYAVKIGRFEGTSFDTLGRMADLIVSKQ